MRIFACSETFVLTCGRIYQVVWNFVLSLGEGAMYIPSPFFFALKAQNDLRQRQDTDVSG